MKKIYLLISILLICSNILTAQVPENRTAKTVIADALAQLPAQKASDYNKVIKEIVSTGQDGVLQLVDMMNPPGEGDNSRIEYALSGLSHYVSAEGQESSRLVTSNAYLKTLETAKDRETKAFIIRQLEIVAKDEAVTKLSSYLNDQTLSGPAARALAAIGSQPAADSLLAALGTANNDKPKEDIILALAFIQEPKAEIPLRELVNGSDGNLKKAILYALSRTGSKASLSELASEAEKDGYTMEKDGATEAYITLIKRVLAQGNVKDAEKAANDLMKKATKAGKIQSRCAALEIQMAINPSSASKLLQNALKDTDKIYRNAAIRYALKYADTPMYTAMMESLPKASIDVKADILGSIPQSDSSLRQEITGICLPAVLKELNNDNIKVKKAAVDALVWINDPTAIPVLANMLTSNDPNAVALSQKALASFASNIAPEIAKIIPSAPDAGKIAGLQLLALRKSTTDLNTVIEQTNSSSPEVKTAAYKALKDVVTEKDLNNLYTMLENADAEAVNPIQQALIAALATQPKEKQVETIAARMNKADKAKQPFYYTVLAATGDAKALNTIAEGFSKSDGAGKDMAFEALLSWKNMDAADILYTICTQADSKYFDKALNRYIQLVSNPKQTGENRRLYLTRALEIAKTSKQKNDILKQIGQTNSYLGMLLAGEYLDKEDTKQAAAGAVMKIALANKNYTGDNVVVLLNKVMKILDHPDADYDRKALGKHLAEMPQEKGFVSIFNGKDLTGWKGLVKNPIERAKMKPAELKKEQVKADEQMHRDWKVEDNSIVYYGNGYNNICTDKQYGDIEMHIDWMLDPAGPEPDGGIYLRGTPQVQIWDTARVNVGAQVGSGGLYNNQANPSKPLVVADNKLGDWNTFYIKMVGDRVTVKLNGVLVVDNIILENFWDRSQPIPPIEQLELQAHGCRIYYKNIYVKELERPEPFKLSAQEEKEGFKILFDGTNMHQWQGNTTDYILEDGCISMHPSKRFGGNLYTKKEYGNFIYRFEFQLTPGANNGVGIRAEKDKDAAYHGMEIQILDHDNPIYKNITKYQVHGSVYGIIAAKRAKLKPIGEWNYEEIIADGDNIKVTLNGEVILDGNIRDAVKDGTPDKKQHPGLFNEKGYIGFLGHGSPVKFRNIRIKELK